MMLSSASAANITSDMDSAAIQNAIDGAAEGEEISFELHDYQDISLVINKSLNLQGNGATLNYNPNNIVVLNISNTEYVTINGFIINGGRAIVANTVNNLNITNNIINMETENDAISLTSVKGALINNNKLYGNTIGRDGIGLVNASDITVSNNDIFQFYRNGISLAAGRLGGLNDTSTYNILIKGNNIYAIGQEGIFFGGGVTQVVIKDNYFLGIYGNAINIARSSTNILIKNNNIINCFVGIRVVEGDTVHDPNTATELDNVTIKNNIFTGNYIAIELVNVINSTNNPGLNIANNLFFNNENDIIDVTEAETTELPVNESPSLLKQILTKICSIISGILKLFQW